MKTVKTIRITALALMLAGFSVLFSGNAAAQIEANVALTSDYLFRGVTQTMNEPALQGGFDYGHDSGFYIGTWGSNVDFGGEESLELDYYAGYGNELDNGFSFDIGYIYYDYFAGNLSLQEVYGSIGFLGFTLAAAFETDGLDGDNPYYSLDYGYDFEQGFSLYAGVGRYDFDEAVAEAYTHYWIGASAEFLDLTWDISYHNGDTAFEDFGGKSRGVVTVSKSF